MTFERYLEKLAKKEFIKKGQLWKLFYGEVSGYQFNEDSITVYFRTGKSKELTWVPYSMEYLKQCHSCGYHILHKSSQKKVKMPVHTIKVHCESEAVTTMKIVTTNEYLYDYIEKQYDAISFIKDHKLVCGDKSIVLEHSYGMGRTIKKVWFENSMEYSNFKDQVTLETKDGNDEEMKDSTK